jgi:hypothetical protein
MKINEVDDIKIDDDRNTYRQSFLEKLVEAEQQVQRGECDTCTVDEFLKKLNKSINSDGDIKW